MIERYKELTPRGEYVLVVEGKPKVKENEDITPVSYTHLDVYKRQAPADR